ncbi:class I SAM-dependent methyltransferase [Bradyrhizobium japonicum]
MQDTAPRHQDGSAGDANYGAIGKGYTNFRRPDPRIAELIDAALSEARTILNVGAGAGSYEPVGRTVTPVEPSQSMRAQRPAHLPAAIDAVAEKLPFEDATFGAAMSTFSVHQWKNLNAGLSEMRRVTRGPIAIMTCAPTSSIASGSTPIAGGDRGRGCALSGNPRYRGRPRRHNGCPARPDPARLHRRFQRGLLRPPEMLLDPAARLACSAWSFVADDVVRRFEDRLGNDLVSGRWDARHGHYRQHPTFVGSLKLIVNHI